ISVVALSFAQRVVVGNRMSAEAMAVVIGVLCGVTASIPMSAVILAMMRRSRPAVDERQTNASRPPVLVVAPSPVPQAAPVAWPGYAAAYPAPAVPAPREYHIIGDDAL
ncbi:MAG TPA: hypothetical protein PLG21_17335, partial [Anaerolineae bacterium]|nr:hypothetical protein [Anaerolineae bacterium]